MTIQVGLSNKSFKLKQSNGTFGPQLASVNARNGARQAHLTPASV
jgi:hypothetical protein